VAFFVEPPHKLSYLMEAGNGDDRRTGDDRRKGDGSGRRSTKENPRHKQRSSPETEHSEQQGALDSVSDILDYLRAGRPHEAIRCLGQKRQAGNTIHVKIYSMIIRACGQFNMLDEAKRVFAMMKAGGTRPDQIVYTLMISMSRGQQALDFFDQMMADGLEPDGQVYTAILNSLSRAKGWALALKILQGMKEQSVETNAMHFTTVLKHFRESHACGKWALALQLFSSMPEDGIQRDTACHNAMMQVLKSAHQWEKAYEIFADMRSSTTCAPNLISCSLMATCHRQSGDWAAAVELLETARQQGIQLDTRVYQDLICTTMKAQRWAAAIKVFDSFEETGATGQANLHCMALEAAQRNQEWKKALSILAGIQDKCLPLKDYAVEWAAAACSETASWEQALVLFNMRQQRKARLSQTSCESIIAAHQSAGRWQASLKILDEMKEEGLMDRDCIQQPASQQVETRQKSRHSREYLHLAQLVVPPRSVPTAAQFPQAGAYNRQVLQYAQPLFQDVGSQSHQAAGTSYQDHAYQILQAGHVPWCPSQHMLPGVLGFAQNPHPHWGSHQHPQNMMEAVQGVAQTPQAHWESHLQNRHLAQGVEHNVPTGRGSQPNFWSGSSSYNHQ